MKTIFGFGDSFTEGNVETYEPFLQWKEYRGGNLPKDWITLLGERLKCNLINYAKGGVGNDYIFHTFCSHSHEIDKGDIIIINWTYNTRFRWAETIDNVNNWINVSRMDLDDKSNNYINKRLSTISKKTIEEILTNRFNELHNQDIYNFEKIITELSILKGYNVYFWSADSDLIYSQPVEIKNQIKYILGNQINNGECMFDLIYKNGGKSIPQETHYKVNDGNHMGESGHMVQCELFYNYITNITKKII